MASIQSSDFVVHPALAMNQTGTAGGIINSAIALPDNQLASLIEDITEAERIAGLSGLTARHYKCYVKIGNSENKTLKEGRVFLRTQLEGDYILHLLKGTYTDIWSTTYADRKYGAGFLGISATAGASSIVINTRGAAFAHFQNGDTIAICSQSTPSDGGGKIEYTTIDQNVVWNGSEATIHISTPLRYDYPTSRTVNGVVIKTQISSCIPYGDVKGTCTVSDKVSAHGTTNSTDYITVSSKAGITQTLTLTFTSSTAFNVASNLGITLAAGSTDTTYAPENPNYFLPYIQITPAFWGNDGSGNWTAGDSVKITTNPAAMPFWIVITCDAESSAEDLQIVDIWLTGRTSTSY